MLICTNAYVAELVYYTMNAVRDDRLGYLNGMALYREFIFPFFFLSVLMTRKAREAFQISMVMMADVFMITFVSSRCSNSTTRSSTF